MLERLVSERPERIRIAVDSDSVVGYVMLRPGANATQIGPAVAASEQAGRALCDWALGQCAGQPVFIDVPLQNGPAIEWAGARGLTEQRQFCRMFRGRRVEEVAALLWASSGPEKG
jgi:hypothetical protein